MNTIYYTAAETYKRLYIGLHDPSPALLTDIECFLARLKGSESWLFRWQLHQAKQPIKVGDWRWIDFTRNYAYSTIPLTRHVLSGPDDWEGLRVRDMINLLADRTGAMWVGCNVTQSECYHYTLPSTEPQSLDFMHCYAALSALEKRIRTVLSNASLTPARWELDTARPGFVLRAKPGFSVERRRGGLIVFAHRHEPLPAPIVQQRAEQALALLAQAGIGAQIIQAPGVIKIITDQALQRALWQFPNDQTRVREFLRREPDCGGHTL